LTTLPTLHTESVPFDVDTLLPSDLTRPEWTTRVPQFACSRDPLPGGVFYLNANQDAPAGGCAYALMPSPAVAARCVFEFEVKLPDGASPAPVAAVIYIPSVNQFTYASATPTTEWQRVSVSFNAVSGAEHQVSIAVNHTGVGAGPQARCLVRNARARYEGGHSLVTLPFRLFDLASSPIYHGIPNDDHVEKGPRTGSQARVIFKTNAPRIGIRWHSTLGSFPGQDKLVVRINGDTVIALSPEAHGIMLYSEVDLPGLGECTVEIINGIQANHRLIYGDQPGAPPDDPIGVYMHALVVPETAHIEFLRPRPQRRILFVGASIVSGWVSEPPQTESWTAMIRDALAPDADVRLQAWGWRPCWTIAHDQAAIDAFVAQIQASGYDPTDLVLHLETNDYAGAASNGDGGGAWSAAAYQIGKGNLVDALLAAFPGATIWLPSMEIRADEGGPNAHGSVPQDYRTATAAIAAARDPERVRYVNGLDIITSNDLIDACHFKPDAASKVARFWVDLLRRQLHP
jgi:hypothetical protein